MPKLYYLNLFVAITIFPGRIPYPVNGHSFPTASVGKLSWKVL